MSEKRLIVTNTIANGVAQFASLLSALIFMPWLISRFGLTDFGLYLIASSVGAYASVLDFGVGATLVKKIAERSAVGDHEGTGELISNGLIFYVVVGIVAAVIMLIVGLNASVLFHVSADSARLLRNLLLVAAAASLWSWPASTANYVLAGRQRYTLAARVAVGATFANIAVTAAVVVMHQGPLVLLLGTTAVGVLSGMVTIALAKREIATAGVSLGRLDWPAMKSIFKFSWAIFVIQLCVVVVYEQTDRIVLAVFIGASAVALYEGAGKFQGLVRQGVNFANSAVLPMASSLDSQGRHDAKRTLFLRGTKYTLALIGPLVVVLIVLARPLLQAWLGAVLKAQGADVSVVALAAQIMVSHQLLTAGTTVGDNMIIGTGQLQKRLPYAIGLTLANLAISLTLVTRLGIMGVVLGTAIPYFLDYPLHMYQQLKWLDVPARRWLREVVLPTYPLLLVPLGVCVLALGTPLIGSLPGLAVVGAAAMGLYWVALFIFGLSDVEKEEARILATRVRARLGGTGS